MRLALLLVLGVTANAYAQAQAPNRLDVVSQVTADPASNFACAHVESCGDDRFDWVKAVAWALHQADPRFGLNMKRDNDSQGLSMDAITFRRGPTDRHVEVYDICGGCGAPGARPAWQDVTDYARLGQPGTARWVQPVAPSGASPVPTPTLPVVTPANLQPVLDAIAALSKQNDALRARLDAIEPLVAAAKYESLNAASRASEIKTQIENLPKHGAVAPTCFKGSIFGKSTRFCPE